MTINEKENILNIIKQFNYTPESFEFMKAHLDDRYLDSFIKEVFSKAEDGRLYFDIETRFKEDVDLGWEMFKKEFMHFIATYKVKYQNFVDNRILINKNEFKLQKAIIQYECDRAASEKGMNNLLRGENVYFHEVFSSTYKEDMECNASSIICFGNDPVEKRYLFSTFEPGRRYPNTHTHEDIRFRDGRKNRENLIASSASFRNFSSNFFDTFIITYDPENSVYSIYTNGKKEDRLEPYRLIKNRDLTELEQNDFFGSDNPIYKRTFIQETYNGETNESKLKLWFVKDNIVCFSDIIIDNEKIKISFAPVVRTNIVFPYTCKFNVRKVDNEFFFSFSSLEEDKLFYYKSNDGIIFNIETPVIRELEPNYQGSYSFSQNISSFYNARERSLHFISSSPGSKSISTEEKLLIEKRVTKKMEEIGARTLPKDKKIKLVLSINFVDWLLCSTGEAWTSCLNFESKFHAAHYQGLPGLLGDPNRVMAYFTTGEKKEYHGLVADKIITRSWVLLDKNNVFNLVKFYPFELISASEMSRITGIKFKPIDYIEDEPFKTKNPIKLLEYKYPHDDNYNFSCYIYQDKTTFSFSNPNDIYLSYNGDKGFYSLYRNTKTQELFMVKAFNFQYEGGFKNLQKEDKPLTYYAVPVKFKLIKCHICGHDSELPFHTETGKRYFEYNNKPVCHRCFERHFKKCDCCGLLDVKTSSEKNINHYPGGTYCADCWEKRRKEIETKKKPSLSIKTISIKEMVEKMARAQATNTYEVLDENQDYNPIPNTMPQRAAAPVPQEIPQEPVYYQATYTTMPYKINLVNPYADDDENDETPPF